MITLTDDGDLMMMGGYNYNKLRGGELDNDNFSPLGTVYLLPVGQHKQAKQGTVAWPWMVLMVALAAAAALVLLRRKRRAESETVIADAPEAIEPTNDNEELMRRICELMEQEKLYLNNKLKLTDVAERLGSNRNVISACINTQCGYSFSQFISKYRVEHAKELLRQHPDLKSAEVWSESGFTTESSFFRAFKAITGMTPSDFKAKND